jgi:acyl-coenzyme A thioesterase PaaI-like protein
VSLSARGRVLKPGRNIFVCAGDVFAVDAQGGETLVATMLATMMVVRDRPGLVD